MFDLLGLLFVFAVAGIGIVLLFASRRPKQFHTSRSLPIAAAPERLHGLISSLRQMNTWNPYALRETGGSSSYSGPASGPGAEFHFNGPKSGTGTISILDTGPSKIVMRLLMTKPFRVDNRIEFTLKPEGEATTVTWAMSGSQPMFARVMSLIIDCDRMVGRDFDEGLANLKAIAEKA